MIWKFDNCNVYVLGSVHAMSADQNTHAKSIDTTIDLVSRVVFETSLEYNDLPITRYENEKLSDHISKALFRDVKEKWIKYDLDLSSLESSKIWNAALLIANRITNSIGLDYENGVDKIVWGKSQVRKKNIEWLEDLEAGYLCFDNSPIEEQRKYLTEVVRNKKKGIRVISEIIEAWNSADEVRLLSILETSLEEYPTLYNCLVFERNLQWVNKFLEALRSDTPTLFVVGVLHCVGEGSILNILNRDHGYSSKLINA